MKQYRTIPEYRLKKIKSNIPQAKIYNTDDAYKYALQFYHDDINIYESVFVLMLDSGNNTIGYAKISQGGTVGSWIDNKIILKYSIDSMCDGVILVHNHPSGSLTPSADDIKITKIIEESLKLWGVMLYDHLIITAENGYTSIIDKI